MKKITLSGHMKTSTIYVGYEMEDFIRSFEDRNTVIITDKNVERLYGNRFSGFRRVVIDGGEADKTIDTVKYIYHNFLNLGCERDTVVIGIGGGVVCDIAGFVASTYLRGLSFGFVATTLLAQVDAAIGGKNGVNFNGYKNMVGTINQPEFVICDPSTLKTLPQDELSNGMAELIKHAVIGDKELFYMIERDRFALLNLDIKHIEPIIFRSIKVKVNIVEKDETERHERRKLNFGHTYGHAIESKLGLKHGEAVSIGMIIEAGLSIQRGLLQPEELRQIKTLLSFFGLPFEIGKDKRHMLMEAILKDKKKEGDIIYSVLIDGIGNTVIEKIHIKEIERLMHDMCMS